jgi:hypothetical protein
MRGTKQKSAPLICEQQYELVPIDEIHPHPRNARQGDVGAIGLSIQANQFYGACVVQRSTRNILAGNHRWISARQCGLTEIPVIWIDCDDAKALRILLVDNRTNDLACYDEPHLAETLQSLLSDAGSLDGSGFDMAAMNDLLAQLGDSHLENCGGSSESSNSSQDGGRDIVECPECGCQFRLGPGNHGA